MFRSKWIGHGVAALTLTAMTVLPVTVSGDPIKKGVDLLKVKSGKLEYKPKKGGPVIDIKLVGKPEGKKGPKLKSEKLKDPSIAKLGPKLEETPTPSSGA